MTYFGLSDKGRHRAENQDSFDLGQVGENVLAVVCDGMGGAAAGLLASDMAAARFMGFARAGLESKGEPPDDVLREAADAANRKVYHFACQSEEYAGMGTTLVAAYIRPDAVTIVNVGDSRAYRIARDGLMRVTKDHSLVQQMVDRGELTPAQAQKHPRRNIITRAVGTEPFVTSDIFELPVRAGDVFLLCSDGLTNALEEAELHRLVLASESAEDACRVLVEKALENDARDNVTAVIVAVGKGGGEDE